MNKVICFVVFSLVLIHAEVLFSDDFDNGWSQWTVNGPTVRSNSLHYISGESVRIRDNTILTRAVSTAGKTNVHIKYSLAAGVLENGDWCYFEITTDGTNWVAIKELTNGQDDNVFNVGIYQDGAIDDNADLAIRYRVVGSGSDNCYLEDTEVYTTSGERTLLPYSDLIGGVNAGEIIPTYAFEASSLATAASNTFEGVLTLSPTVGSWDVIADTYGGFDVAGNEILPSFSISFVQNGDDLIPKEQGRVETTHVRWEYIVGPGKVWDESTDNGYSRASFPFTLVEKNSNCVHNGLMTFLFKTGGLVSYTSYQVASETCLYAKADMWGTIPTSYSAGAVSGKSTIISEFNAEVSGRVPTKDLAELATDFPGTNPATFGSEITPEHLSSYGVVYNNVHYVNTPNTRAGAYIYPDSLVLPSYSTAKSSLVGLALLRLEEKYGNMFTKIVSDWVPQCSNTKWGSVTFDNAIDMATGLYASTIYNRDELNSDSISYSWFLETTHADKIDWACNHYSNKASPNTKWVYHTTDTYILATALEAYIQSVEGKTLYELVNDDVYGPNGQSKMMMGSGHTTYDATHNPFGGFGMFYTRDDVAKLSNLFHNDGVIGSTQVLDLTATLKTMQKDPSDTGISTTASGFVYNNAFWAKQHSYSGCSSQNIPFMSGFGGITVALLPSQVTYYYFSDNDEFGWAGSTQATSTIAPLC